MTFTQALTDRAPLGEEPRNLFCNPWKVYLDFDFTGSDTQTVQSGDVLKSIDVRKEGVCF
jgi:hypothetical protein